MATLSLIRREFGAYFLSPIGYVVMAVFLLVTGQMFFQTMEKLTASGPNGIEYPMQGLLGFVDLNTIPGMLQFLLFWVVYLIIPPVLTMRLFAEERNSGTLEMLLTAPVRDWQIVLSKFLACYLFYMVMWLPTLFYLPILLNMDWSSFPPTAGIDVWPVVSTYLGLMLAGAMFLSIGLLISSLVRSQIVAALVSILISMVFVVAGFLRQGLEAGPANRFVEFFAVPMHFERNFTRGVVDTRNLVLYATVTLFCLFLTVRSLESRRWR